MDVEVREVEGEREGTDRGVQAGGATVSGTKPETEGAVVAEPLWQEIRTRHAAGESVSALAREFGLDRKTVRRCLRDERWRGYRREVKAPGLLDAHLEWLKGRAPEVRYSARILWQELRRDRGFTGSYEVVKLAVRPLRAMASVASLTQARFETAPGEQAQVDWGQATVQMGEARAQVHIFVMTLGYSRRAYAEGFTNERMDSLLAAHERAFAHFGGCCETLLYDRMRTVVSGEDADEQGRRRVKFNTTFLAFAQYWGFSPRACRPYRARTKGKVESGVKYVKGNFLPGRRFRDLEDFNAQLAAWQSEVADVREHGTTHERPIERFAAEAPALRPTGGQSSFLQAMVRERVVAEDWLISLDGNRYSVPFGLIGQTVQVVREGGVLVIRHAGAVVARHPVLAGRAQTDVLPEHGPGAVSRNARRRFTSPGGALASEAETREVEIRDLAIYDQLVEAASSPLQEAA